MLLFNKSRIICLHSYFCKGPGLEHNPQFLKQALLVTYKYIIRFNIFNNTYGIATKIIYTYLTNVTIPNF